MKRFLCCVLLLSLLLVSCGREKASSRVIVLALDGVDPHTVDLLMSEGRMPNFAKMKRDGAYAPLTSEIPLLSPIIWTTVATGKRPDQHRIGHFTAVNPQTGEQLPVTSQMRKAKALWNILSESQRSVAVTGWWATWPAESVNGTIVSDHLAYHFLFQEAVTGKATDATGKTHPPELLAEVAPLVVRPQNVGLDVVSRYLDVTQAELDRPFDFHDRIGHFRWAWGASETYKKIGLHLWETRKPDVLMVYIEGVDSTSHLFGHLFRAEGLAGDLADQQLKYGRAVEEMYVHIDAVVGEYMKAMDDRTMLVVLSDHGFELGKLPDDPSTTQELTRVSEKFHRLRGILYMYGNGIRRTSLDRPSIVDIAPTVLALTGVPAAKDMPGRVLTEALETPEQARIASYESGGAAVASTTIATDAKVDPEVLEKLKSLGYINATSPSGDASLAAVLFQQGRYEEAVEAYEKLVAASPDSASLRSSYAGALGSMKRFDEALEQLDAAIRIDPINVEAYHNRGVIRELKGDRAAAIKDYQAAMRYGSFEPSRQALLRLGAPESGVEVRTEAEQRAAELVQQAADAAKRGDYPGANRLLDDAEKTAPRFVLVYQYRSNVAYLSGDIDGAIRAIEKGLAIEPDNQLFRTNLARLKETKASQGR